MTKIEQIKEAIERALRRESKLNGEALMVPALSSLNIRHLMNNLGGISTDYFECGVHRGGLFCSTLYGNSNIRYATANDNFASDMSGEQAEQDFIQNVSSYKDDATYFHLIKKDTFIIDVEEEMPEGVNLYLFDADHSYESQRKAVTHFLASMADEFIMCIDDFDWEEVSQGTRDGLTDAGVEVLFEEVWKGNNHDNEGAWNGFAIFLLKKK